ncbi:MAG TPA: hypothetical protein DCF62_05975 [Porticoccaceae bacterium]|nr:hypothetical protein [Porticoccaceae bacterium]HCO60712.1 hypothetical protein [Porticoccaceae bacterium]
MATSRNGTEAVRGSCFRGQINRPDLRQLLLERELSRLLSNGKIIKEDKNRKILAINTGPDSKVFVKLHREESPLERLKTAVLGSRAQRSHRKSELLDSRGLPGSASYGFIDIFDYEGRGSVHFSELLSDTETLAKTLATNPCSSPIKSASKLIATLHQQGLIHGDLKLTNLMVRGEKLYFVDLDGLRRSSSSRLRARDIARFLVALSEANTELSMTRSAFATYCQTLGIPEQALHERVIAIAKTFQKKHLTKYQRPPRPVL